MGKIFKKIVLTGGPCAGKSSSLDLIREYLTDKGFLVLVVPESATELINSGIKPFGEASISMMAFQDVILNYQLNKENIIESVAKNIIDKEVVIIYDRGVIDNKAYIGQEKFDELLNKYNLKEIDLLDRYDLIIHLETGAKSNFYTTINNKARSEDEEQAIVMDNKTYSSWINHRNLKRVKCFEDFKDKQSCIINIIDKEFYNNNVVQNKYLVSINDSIIDDEVFYINQYYLDFGDNIDSFKVIEHRSREVEFKGKKSYYYTVKERYISGKTVILEDNIISEDEYNYLLNNYKILNKVSKIRKYIVHNDKQYNIDIFNNGIVLLESNHRIDENIFDIRCDVSKDESFLNRNIVTEDEKILNKKYTS